MSPFLSYHFCNPLSHCIPGIVAEVLVVMGCDVISIFVIAENLEH